MCEVYEEVKIMNKLKSFTAVFIFFLFMNLESRALEQMQWAHPQFKANSPVDLFRARFAAFKSLSGSERNSAEAFLLRTMTISQKDYKFKEKADFVKSVVKWENPEVLASRDQDNLRAVVYRIRYRTAREKNELHEISFFNKDGGIYRFTHKMSLKANPNFSVMRESTRLIRQYGDTVLKSQACEIENWPSQQNEVLTQVETLKEALRLTGGVGIAANQCLQVAHPLKIVIVGVDYSDEVHVRNALYRYPTTLFQPFQVMINPRLEGAFGEATFEEGCLSLQGPIRASILRAETVRISYLNVSGKTESGVLSGNDARVLLHELDHIQLGKTYFDHVLAELSAPQLQELKSLVDHELKSRTMRTFAITRAQDNQAPRLVFPRGPEGKLRFDEGAFQELLPFYLSSCLTGVARELNRLIDGNVSLSDGEV